METFVADIGMASMFANAALAELLRLEVTHRCSYDY